MRYAIFLLMFLVACAGTVEVDNDLSDTNLEKTYADENVEVTTTVEDGIIKNDVDIDVEEEVNLDECPAGETVDIKTEEGDVTANVIGLEQFKGEEFCHAVSTTTIQGYEITSDYYFKGKTIWVVADVMGQKSETKVELE